MTIQAFNKFINFVKNHGLFISIIVLVVILIIIIFSLFFYVFSPTQPSYISISKQFWSFLESTGFSVLVVSFFLPILILLIGQIFKISERVEIRESTLKQEKKEFQRKEREEKKQFQLKTIEDTQKLWDELITISSTLRYYYDSEETKIEKILIRINQFVIKAEDIVNMWIFRFDRLNDYETYNINLLITPLDVLIGSTLTVAQHIKAQNIKTSPDVDIDLLKLALGNIEDNVKDNVHPQIIAILNDIMAYEYYSDNEEKIDQVNRADKRIKNNLSNLSKWNNCINKFIDKKVKITDFMLYKYDSTEKLQSKCDELELFCRENPSRSYNEFRDINELKEFYCNLNHKERLQYSKLPFNYNFIIKLAEKIDFHYLCEEIETRAQYPSHYDEFYELYDRS